MPFASSVLTQQDAQVFDYGLETTDIDPAPHLLIDHRPLRQIVGQHAPAVAGLGHVAKSVKNCPQWILALTGISSAQLR